MHKHDSFKDGMIFVLTDIYIYLLMKNTVKIFNSYYYQKSDTE